MLGGGESILRVALHAEGKGFEALQEEERAEGRDCAAGVAKAFDARLEDEGDGAKGFDVGEAVVGGVGIDEGGEAAGGLPVELRSEERRVGKECRSRWS